MATDAERLWPALSDDELAASAALVTTTATVTTTQQRLLLPSPAGELSAFLGAGASSSGAQNFLDDLLSDDADAAQPSQSFQLLQGHEDGAVAGAMSDGGVLSDAAFFSLGEEHRAEQSTSYSSSASGSPTTGANASRLLQLETNYERKKKRAKINRKDLNSRFQELMDILHLKEDRKLNRAKILEKTIEHIEKLTAELNALKAGHQPQQGLNQTQQTHARKTAVALQHPHQFHGITSAMAHSMGHHSATSSAHANVSTGAPILPFNPSHNHPWSAAGVGTSLPLAQMMWVPCPVVTSSGMMLKRAAPGRPIDTSTRKRGRVESVESVTTTVSEPATSSSEIESVPETSDVMMTSVSSVEKDASMFVWSALEIPTLLSYCDAWTLATVMRVSRELRHAATSDKLWADLSRERWRLPFTTSITQPRQQWQQWHALNRIPDCSAFTVRLLLFRVVLVPGFFVSDILLVLSASSAGWVLVCVW
ncbi:unnamed protein product [Phytophthora lilii]|uniref:Unnamed protein product n=1 Tax=Phytophthora lilii TaxID=2077276 RepID=A0A9W6X2H3_9STRA|nr:unnamed protein product [Phytophthora lilii]